MLFSLPLTHRQLVVTLVSQQCSMPLQRASPSSPDKGYFLQGDISRSRLTWKIRTLELGEGSHQSAEEDRCGDTESKINPVQRSRHVARRCIMKYTSTISPASRCYSRNDSVQDGLPLCRAYVIDILKRRSIRLPRLTRRESESTLKENGITNTRMTYNMHEGTTRRHLSTSSIAGSPTILARTLAKRSVKIESDRAIERCLSIQFQIRLLTATRDQKRSGTLRFELFGLIGDLVESSTSRQPSASLSKISAFFPHTLYTPDTGVPRGLNSWMLSAPWSQVCSRERGGYVCACVGRNSVPHGERGSRSMPRNRGTLESRAHQQASACSAVPIRSGRRALSFANLRASSDVPGCF